MYFLDSCHLVGDDNAELIITLRLEQDIANSIVLLRTNFEDIWFISRKTELIVIKHDQRHITFANKEPIILIKNDLLDILETFWSFWKGILFDYVFWVVVFDVTHQLVDIVLDLKYSNFIVLLHVHYKILAIVWEVYVNQINRVSIIWLLLHVDFFHHINLG